MVAGSVLHPRCTKLLTFWFGDPNNREESGYGTKQLHWWSSSPDLDNRIRDEFLDDYEKARRGEYDAWKEDPYGTLALIILLDQIPRNIFRGQPETYATDDLALELAKLAVERGYAKKIHADADDVYDRLYERQFLMMPFAHSENLEDQAQSVAITREFNVEAWNRRKEEYYQIIKRFGRFPHRNEILGRESTAEEIEYVNTEWRP